MCGSSPAGSIAFSPSDFFQVPSLERHVPLGKTQPCPTANKHHVEEGSGLRTVCGSTDLHRPSQSGSSEADPPGQSSGKGRGGGNYEGPVELLMLGPLLSLSRESPEHPCWGGPSQAGGLARCEQDRAPVAPSQNHTPLPVSPPATSTWVRAATASHPPATQVRHPRGFCSGGGELDCLLKMIWVLRHSSTMNLKRIMIL